MKGSTTRNSKIKHVVPTIVNLDKLPKTFMAVDDVDTKAMFTDLIESMLVSVRIFLVSHRKFSFF